MAHFFRQGDKAYIIDNSMFLREVTILRATRDLCVIKYVDTGAVIRIQKKRLFVTEKETQDYLPPEARPKRKSHWDYYLTHFKHPSFSALLEFQQKKK